MIGAALDDLRLPPERFSLALDPDLPLVRADAAQLERAFANLLENGARYSGGHPVAIRGARDRRAAADPRRRPRARASRPRSATASSSPSTARAARAPAIAARGSGSRSSRGFVEANGGRISVESLPGQGTSFVVEFPAELLQRDAPAPDTTAAGT